METIQPKIRCRQIGDADIENVAGLLACGFPERSRDHWLAGLARMAERSVPECFPRFGYMLDDDGKAVGAILLIFSSAPGTDPRLVRCNLSSWYVDPAFRGHASPLIFVSLKHKNVTYVNISPAEHTWPTIEAQGFACYGKGQLISLPALSAPEPDVTVRQIATDATAAAAACPEARLLARHSGFGCLSLVADTLDGPLPFVFAPTTPVRKGPLALPCMQLVYCRDTRDFVRVAGNLGRFLARRAKFLVALDADGPIEGLRGFHRPTRGRRYFKGPNPPRLGDLADTELVLFGT